MGALQLSGILSNGVIPPNGARPLTPFTQPVRWTRGEDGTIKVVVKDPSGALANLTDCALFFHLKRRGDAAPFVERLAVLTDPVCGEAVFYFVADDTSALSDADQFYLDVWLYDDAGGHQVVLSSMFIILESEAGDNEDPSDPIFISPINGGAVDTINTTGATLASLDATHLGDGFPYWVRAERSFFHIEIGNGYATDDPSRAIAALNLTNGQWVRGLGG